MSTRMLIDARHPEETRVAVLKGNRIEEFDFESSEHKQIKGNIYLAKVTRVEPSLQAAFVDFGGNRHGFLAFSEIHPDYYQIPASDREALIAEEAAAAEEEAALRAADEDDDRDYDGDGDDRNDDHERGSYDSAGVEEIDTSEKDHVATIEDGQLQNGDDADDAYGDEDDADEDHETEGDAEAHDAEGAEGEEPAPRGRGRRQGRDRKGDRSGERRGGNRARAMDEVRAKRQALRRRYKIQDVIQRRQVLLVQVVKEERGNKGAALTTYLSLAGRYCVLMPNSTHGGGISRKINSGSDRKRLKQIVAELTLPRSMGLIVRTAGLQRTKTEIKRDFDYLARLWDEIRERTLKSSAPAMIHSDSDLIKRAIRDIYNREIEEVVVEGEEGYRSAREFMKLLMPSHARRVKHYSDPVPLFQRYGAEDQLSAMYDPVVQLKSGGYLVINPTEALVSIDINSGRSTKEYGIEATALNTNLEAAREIARQLRLRDMAGLVVIDFIDMENSSSVRKVERAMKESLQNDRARIQVGRISGFGLMEMSRQRLRTGVLEATTRSCPHCDGTGLVRTASSAGLSALRLIEDEAAKGKGTIISLFASTEAAIYLLNAKRTDLSEIEERYGVRVEVIPEGENEGAKMRVASSGPRPLEMPRFAPVILEAEDDLDGPIEEEDDADDEGFENERPRSEDEDGQRRKRRRRRRGGRDRARENDEDGEASAEGEDPTEGDDQGERPAIAGEEGDDRPRRKRRRGGRGRNRRRDSEGSEGANEGADEGTQDATTHEEGYGEPVTEEDGAAIATEQTEAMAEVVADAEPVEAPVEKPKRRSRAKKVPEVVAEEVPTNVAPAAAQAEEAPVEDVPAPKRRRRTTKAEAAAAEAVAPDQGAAEPAGEEAPKPARRPRKRKADADAAVEAPAPAVEAEPAAETPSPAEVATAEAPIAKAAAADTPVVATEASANTDGDAQDGQPPRRGWWQRTFGA